MTEASQQTEQGARKGQPRQAPVALTADEWCKLKTEHVRVLSLFNEGMSYASIAATEGVAIGTVRSRLNRARAAVAAMRG